MDDPPAGFPRCFTASRRRRPFIVPHICDVEQLRQVARDIVGDLTAYDLFITPTPTQLPCPFGYYDMSETDIDRYNAKWAGTAEPFPSWKGLGQSPE
ncbi:hypothetical protein [Mesorhizobium sp. NZP2077]|uniref:hypothetical protein n=1 Tax=Mesorhizobium sp. NZP2077 TaxID=2483404 RepID=UPI001FEDE438|nr:hypothetical protein [Mesorhizobium sp. NZP2077]